MEGWVEGWREEAELEQNSQPVPAEGGIVAAAESPELCFPFHTHPLSKKSNSFIDINSETHQELLFPGKFCWDVWQHQKDLQMDYLANSLVYESREIWQCLVIDVLLSLKGGNKSQRLFYLGRGRERVLSALHLHYLSPASKLRAG